MRFGLFFQILYFIYIALFLYFFNITILVHGTVLCKLYTLMLAKVQIVYVVP